MSIYEYKFWQKRYYDLLDMLNTKFIKVDFKIKNAVLRAKQYAEDRRNHFQMMEFSLLLNDINKLLKEQKEKRK